MKKIFIITILLALVAIGSANAQDFINLSNEDLRIDSVLPSYSFIEDLGYDYADKTYKVELEYPRFQLFRYRSAHEIQLRIPTTRLPPKPIQPSHSGLLLQSILY